MPQRFGAICLLVMITCVPCLATSHDEDIVTFAMDEHGGVAVPVFVGGTGHSSCSTTGSSGSSVSESFARRIGAGAVAKAEIDTAAGRAVRAVIQLPRVAVGSNYTLDYRSRTLIWLADIGRERGTRLALVRRDMQVLVESAESRTDYP